MIFFVQVSQGQQASFLFQPKAFFIVLGGTFCATLLNFSFPVVKNSLISSVEIFKKSKDDILSTIEQIVSLSIYSKRNVFFSLNQLMDQIENPFLKRALSLAIDVNNPQVFYDILINEIEYEEETALINSRVFEAMGGYCPTFGIVGAVLGLIEVMSNVQNLELLASGIATAFVATLYGVLAANLIFLPIGGSLKLILRRKILEKEMILQGVISIQMEESPAIIEEKLFSFAKHSCLPYRSETQFANLPEDI